MKVMQTSSPQVQFTSQSVKPVSSTNPFKDLRPIKSISKSKFPVFLAYSESQKKFYAMKVFPYENYDISLYFENEVQFASFSHPNLLPILHVQPLKKNFYAGRDLDVSFIVTELAPYGDFSKLLLSEQLPKDEKLVRTFFHHLIEALEYLHSNGCAHTDVKLENLLLAEDFTLKLADFDTAISLTEGTIPSVGTGTRNFRAPEVKARKCKSPKAADVFSAAIVLFTLLTGYLPYNEDTTTQGYDLEKLLVTESPLFWEAHKEIHGKQLGLSDDFKRIFTWMVRAEQYRATIADVKKSNWYQG